MKGFDLLAWKPLNFLLFFLSAISLAYVYFSRSPSLLAQREEIPRSNNGSSECNLFDGRWVSDESYPLYNTCRYLENGFDCRRNGRKDLGFEKLRWKPTNCEIPRFDVGEALNLLRGKRVIFVGDSLARSQWESLTCMLSTGVDDRSIVSELKGDKISKHVQFLTVLFSSFNVRIDFYRSFFLVKTAGVPKNAPEKVRMTLRLDEMEEFSKEWIDSDVLVFNSGDWWSDNRLTQQMACYFRMGNSLYLDMPVLDGFRRAIETWATWVNTKLDSNRTKVFFRTYESTHWSDNDFKVCKVTKYPTKETNGWDRSPYTGIVMDVLKNSTAPIKVLQVSTMGAYRTDAHLGVWNTLHTPDCSHWCLPGVPEVWNEILLYLLHQSAA